MRPVNASLSLFRRRLLDWYRRHRRDLPWRLPKIGHESTAATQSAQAASQARVDPYHVLVSELMLQQTQVATVIPYFKRFIERFPTAADLAAADEQEVLRLWQGLGYYSRARNLQRAAKHVVEKCGGQMPSTVEGLLELPGVGRYTAGAVASIAFERRAPILDGNVMRVLCRLDRVEADPRQPATQEVLWARAEEMLPMASVGDFNSALMELGALICTPRAPQCLLCPVREQCEAFAAGVQERIPPPRKAKATPLFKRHILCVRQGDRWLIEQRPATGRWAGMWQFVTVDPEKDGSPVGLGKRRAIGTVTHGLTHRRYEFDVFVCEGGKVVTDGTGRRWLTLAELDEYPLPRPHVKVAGMLREMAS